MVNRLSLLALARATVGAAVLSLGVAFTPLGQAQAAVLALGNASSPNGGNNTLANLFFMVPVTDSQASDLTPLNALSSPLGIAVNFQPSVLKLTVPTTWATWSHGYTGPVYFPVSSSQASLNFGQNIRSVVLNFSTGVRAFDFYAQPNLLEGTLLIAATARSSGGATASLFQDIAGNAGAQYFGFYSDDPTDLISTVQISIDNQFGFAFGEMRLATQPIPTPALLPGLLGMGLAAWRRRQGESATTSLNPE